jgi:glycoside/pentoside/hexuronide:cation symporter, GPH family
MFSAETLPNKVLFGYGVGDLGIFSATMIVSFFVNPFLLDVAGLSSTNAALILFLTTAYDAISDPIIGYLSDKKVKTPYGRRRPLLLVGSFAFAGLFVGLWQTAHGSEAAKTAYYLIMMLLFKTASTVVSVPYYALVSEVTDDYDVRTKLTSLRLIFSLFSSVITSTVFALLIESFDPIADGYMVASLIFIPICIVPSIVVFCTVPERSSLDDDGSAAAAAAATTWAERWTSVSIVFRNRAFVTLLLAYVLAFLAVNFLQNNLFLYIKYVIDAEDHFTYIILLVQGGAFVSLFAWTPLSARFGKRRVYLGAAASFVCVLVAATFLEGRSMLPGAYVLATLAGLGLGALLLQTWAMLADVADCDEIESGERREGVYFALFILFQKLALAGALGISNAVLGAAGYISHTDGDPHNEQPASVSLALRIMLGPVGAILCALSIVPAYFYPLSRERHGQVLEQLVVLRKQRSECQYGSLIVGSDPMMSSDGESLLHSSTSQSSQSSDDNV